MSDLVGNPEDRFSRDEAQMMGRNRHAVTLNISISFKVLNIRGSWNLAFNVQ